ncbi:hypothetical protein [Rhizobium sp. WYJ-E13]|uniref:hypothetical protein n=1 Tax=Rhizobium sp. WYJ-E13 TaxID=2849093 RepID=UPI001C1F1679|nr:hypothetical protein [Rhizobium sp. WYJ-E13]QWW72471.1 hypothetical protein KQ933_31615 [Rhizobium sp. WYJ-E13]
MAHDDPFTLDLFGNTALSSTFDIAGDIAASSVSHTRSDYDAHRPAAATVPAGPVSAARENRPAQRRKSDLRLTGARRLANTWRACARDNVAAILLAKEIERSGLPARRDQQERLIRFAGFGASELANGMFRRPGADGFRAGWEEPSETSFPSRPSLR